MRFRPRIALLITMTLLVGLFSWWSVLLHRLVTESYEQTVMMVGEQDQAAQLLGRRRTMIVGESATMLVATVVLLALAWRSMVHEERQTERLKVLFAASTHELKTPIAGVRALLESLDAGILPLDAARPHLQRGLESCDRLERLAEGMLVRQAVLSGESPAELRTLSEWLEPVLVRRPPTQRVELELGDAGPTPLRLPGESLRVVLDNLLDNAAKYAPDSPVTLRATREGPTLRLDIADRGPGFAPEDAERIFKPWERGGHAGRAHGTGLGLYLARSIAQEARGQLSARSDGPGRGATFTLTLPVDEGKA